jgi:hypothetical protein
MSISRRWLAIAALAVSGCASGFGIDVDVEPGCVGPADSLAIAVTVTPSMSTQMQTVNAHQFFAGSHHLGIVVPDGATQVMVAVTAKNGTGTEVGSASQTVAVSGHGLVTTTMTLDGTGCAGDGGADLAALPDLVGHDATPPVDLAMVDADNSPILGDFSNGANTDSHNAGQAEASAYQASRTGTITRLGAWFPAGTSTQLSIGLYDDLNGHPHTLLGSGNADFPNPGTFAFANIPPVQVTKGVTYWIALVSPVGKGSFVMGWSNGGIATEHSNQPDLVALPASWTSGQFYNQTINAFNALP